MTLKSIVLTLALYEGKDGVLLLGWRQGLWGQQRSVKTYSHKNLSKKIYWKWVQKKNRYSSSGPSTLFQSINLNQHLLSVSINILRFLKKSLCRAATIILLLVNRLPICHNMIYLCHKIVNNAIYTFTDAMVTVSNGLYQPKVQIPKLFSVFLYMTKWSFKFTHFRSWNQKKICIFEK